MRDAAFRADINGLRGLSVALVVGYHLHARGFDGGFLGVDVFFVVSGYLMTRIVWSGLERGDFSYRGFMASRVARIVPALAVLVGLLLLSGALWLPPFDLALVAEQSLWALGFASNVYFLAHGGYNTQNLDTNWLLHTWSLSIEAQFYLLYPLLLAAAWALAGALRRRWPGLSARTVALVVVLAAFGASLACQLAWSRTWPEGAFFLLPARAWELLAGGLVVLLPDAFAAPPRRGSRWLGLAGLGLLLATALWFGLRHQPPAGLGPLALPPVLAAALLLWAQDPRSLLARPLLQAVGRWSYSIYLWHWPMLIGLRILDADGGRPAPATAAAVVIASLLCGALSYRYVETARGLRGAPAARRLLRRSALGAGLAAAAAGAVAATEGLELGPRRMPAFYRGYTAAAEANYFPGRCSNFLKPAEALAVCRIERRAAGPRILVIGDSHAEHLYAWFERHSELSVDFFTVAECPPVPGFERLQAGYHCAGYAERAWQMAAAPRYRTVVVSARWATVGAQGPPYCRQDGDTCRVPSDAEKPSLVRAALGKAIEDTLAAGKTVVVLDSAPEAPVRVPERLAREFFWYGEARLTIDRRTLLAQTEWIDPLFRDLTASPGFHLLSLRPLLCGAERCRVWDAAAGRPIYLDESHFDPQWISEHGGALLPFVRR